MKFSLLALTALASVATADYYSVNFMPWGTTKAPTGAVTSTYINPTLIDDAAGNSCAQGGLIVLDSKIDWIYYANCSGVAAHFGLASGKSELEYVLNAKKDVYPCLEVGSGSTPVSFTNYVCSKTFTASKKVTVPKLSAPSSATAAPTTATITPSGACTSGFSGKRNGGGPTGACCTASNDCKASCHNGICKTL
ncbi:hypothetical protein INT44_005519 [Umbelopsis vinacea]|uniref:Uncharacterized protein n=1 Tax=Umbelopsis vinacea TaxID=44442 RepID=A0A8H7Q7D1_9FUNG|nr:hypothetical protein INT44_005519 [Umbelopsis vinacea]KAI9287563.1 hypothetical protein BC943DRAFT_378265 [Umbelopsis sp. AD052]